MFELVEVTLVLFYYSKVKFTIVKPISNVTGFFQFTMVNVIIVCRDSHGDRMKAKLTIVKRPEKAWFIMCLSQLCLFTKWTVTGRNSMFLHFLNVTNIDLHVTVNTKSWRFSQVSVMFREGKYEVIFPSYLSQDVSAVVRFRYMYVSSNRFLIS